MAKKCSKSAQNLKIVFTILAFTAIVIGSITSSSSLLLFSAYISAVENRKKKFWQIFFGKIKKKSAFFKLCFHILLQLYGTNVRIWSCLRQKKREREKVSVRFLTVTVNVTCSWYGSSFRVLPNYI